MLKITPSKRDACRSRPVKSSVAPDFGLALASKEDATTKWWGFPHDKKIGHASEYADMSYL